MVGKAMGSASCSGANCSWATSGSYSLFLWFFTFKSNFTREFPQMAVFQTRSQVKGHPARQESGHTEAAKDRWKDVPAGCPAR